MILAHWLLAIAWINAGTSQEEEPMNPSLKDGVDYIALNHYVLVVDDRCYRATA